MLWRNRRLAWELHHLELPVLVAWPSTGLPASGPLRRNSCRVHNKNQSHMSIAGDHRGDVLVVDDDKSIRDLIEFELRSQDIPVRVETTGRGALKAIRSGGVSAVLLDLGLPDIPGQEVLRELRETAPKLPVVVVTGVDDVDVIVSCMRLGAKDFLHKPFDRQRLIASVKNARENGRLRARLARMASAEGLGALVGESQPVRALKELITKVAGTDITVLLQGESGTGKELLARAVHAESERAAEEFVVVNCGAISSGLIESELFGHERGAFTGADKHRIGLFEQANGGTLFLDEIGELEADLQVRLLRALQERQVRRVGSSKNISIDVRIVAATNRDLLGEVGSGGFREDLYYRLSAFPLQVPPLRQRGEDVILLAKTFLAQTSARLGSDVVEFSPAAIDAIRGYAWPGNVRQLQNAIERAVVLSNGPQVRCDALPDDVERVPEQHDRPPVLRRLAEPCAEERKPSRIIPMAEEERRILKNALRVTDWNVGEAALRLGIGRATFYRRIRTHGLVREQDDEHGQGMGT